MKKDASYGIIPFLINEGWEVEFLLIYQKEQYRGFPKGHKEGEESNTQAALRELNEETGITECKILEQYPPFLTNYHFKDKKWELIDKDAYFYLGELDSKRKNQIALDNYEVIDFARGSYQEVREKLTHESNRLILDQAYMLLSEPK